jgi:hypothetical protein
MRYGHGSCYLCLVLSVSYVELTLVVLVHVVVHRVMSTVTHHGAGAIGVSVLMASVGITGMIICRSTKG